ncbi:3-hydroxyacyl-CoA dehydrogenase PaaC [Azoarcus sp. L1K30]|uniref:3-hydroxyacyl-CoA dehydrogenase PaaH n=1 Tax=Azoarcus sp. L1K30 TaxID=2820277 RepID=UPI001B8324FE|nr:3-hydroxyacyl-CoA dehydrogenase PaaH [Azoarcus sp. L1K30]MBR0568949.1 3-hydroxyacyl-CoA dehydrogenase PaaC [Azoarcus sp. L1K30]
MAALATSTKVAVIGAGAMGSGIAHVAARAGHTVYLYDMNADAVARGKAGIEKDLRFLVGKGKLAEAECAATLARVVSSSRIEDLADAGLLIEAIVENLEIKQKLFRQLEDMVGAEAILATNTSSLSITAMGAALTRPARLAGLHFFNPAPRMALVEIVSGLPTDAEVATTLYDTARAWGKVPVRATSTPGFIVNRVARPYYAEGLRVLAERAATPATVDAILREACNFPMGPFELMDLIGHDVNYAVTRSVFDAYFGDKRFTPSLIQQELVLAGRLGRKSGQGFYDYRDGAVKPVATTESPAVAVRAVTAIGHLGVAEALLARFEAAGIEVRREAGEGSGCLRIGAARLALSDGRTATRRAAEEVTPDLVLFDLARDYALTPRLALSRADQCGEQAWCDAVGTLQATGIAVSRVDDIPGLLALRTVCMLANEAADGVVQGIASAADIDTAMRYGTNYPEGPLAWAGRMGASFVTRVLLNLREHYGEERYRVSPLLLRCAQGGSDLLSAEGQSPAI